MTYERFKEWVIVNKEKGVLILCFILVFFVGFGTGSYVKMSTRQSADNGHSYYTTKPQQKAAKIQTGQPGVSTSSLPEADSTKKCAIKGNISASGKKIYHMVGGAFYEKVKPEQCFSSEQEAVAAGFVKSSR